jgi:cell division initiation protein
VRLNHLDILEQCFREKFRGYSKEEVESFLELVSRDFKELEDEIEVLKQKMKRQENKDEDIAELRAELEEKNNIIEQLQKSPGMGAEAQLTPEIIKEKARRVLTAAKEHAEVHRQKAEKELAQIKEEINQLRQEKKNVMESIKKTARDYIDNIKSKTTDRD